MKDIEIREALAEDAERLIEYMKIVGGETENLTFGEGGAACYNRARKTIP